MGADDGTVDDRAYVFDIYPQLSEYLRPDVLLGPVRKSIVDGLPIAESLRQVPPRKPRLRTKNHSVDEKTISALGLSTLCSPREKWL